MTPIFHGEIHAGRINLWTKDKEGLAALIKKLEGKKIELVLRTPKEKRTNPQNALYWSAYIPVFAEFCGYTPDEAHEALKLRFLVKGDGPLPTVRSTSALSTKEFGEYLDCLDRLAAEYGLYIPQLREAEQ